MHDCLVDRLPATDRREIFFTQAGPTQIWREVLDKDTLAMRALLVAIDATVGKGPQQVLLGVLAETLYQAVFRPDGLYVADSDCFARALEISQPKMALLQRQYTLVHALCSTVMAWDENARAMVQFRSLDWPMADALAAATRVFEFTDGTKVVFRAAGIAGMVGVLTAVKTGGFSVAINYAHWQASAWIKRDPTFLLRQLMESPDINTYDQACAAIRSWVPGAPVFVCVCGVKKDEARVFQFGLNEGGRSAKTEVPCRNGLLVHANHYLPAGDDLDDHFAAHNDRQETTGDQAEWYRYPVRRTSRERLSMLTQTLSAVIGTNADLDTALLKAFARPPVWNFETAQWVRMVPATGELSVRTRRPTAPEPPWDHPACPGQP